MAHDIRANLNDLIQSMLSGKLLEAFDKYYADDVVMSENGVDDPARHGKEKNHAYEAFFVANAQWHDARVGNVVVDGDKSAYEMYMDLTFMGNRMTRTQVAVQEWRDGQIIKETFYYQG
jgi:hypothetical protein